MTLEDEAARLYRLPPEEFTAARDEAAKAAKSAGDAKAAQSLKALRRPSASAHLVNLLVVGDTGLVEQLLALGPALAQAQAAGRGDELRALGAQRRALVDAVSRRAASVAGRTVTRAVRDEVAATLEAALADPRAADAVRSGRLVRTLSYTGFGGVDLDGAVAAGPASGARRAPVEKAPGKKASGRKAAVERAGRIATAEAAALEAAGRLDDVVRACESAERERAGAEAAAEQSHAAVERARLALQAAEAEAKEADRRRISTERAGEKAVEEVRRAQRSETQARAELDRLRRG